MTPMSSGFDIPQPDARNDSLLARVFCVLLGTCVTLCVMGYQFGQSNHTVYLLDALRRNDPSLLQHDWFAAQTFQYHALFGIVSAFLLRHDVIQPTFLIGYLSITWLLMLAACKIVRCVGGRLTTFLLAAILFNVLAGGTGLGMYNFLQDSAFLPSNIANVALLWGLYFWMVRRFSSAGLCVGLAGLFHLNHAVVGSALWCALSFLLWADRLDRRQSTAKDVVMGAGFTFGSALAIVPSIVNVITALVARRSVGAPMPLHEFVSLYVRLRHPHHYDPSTWPIALWVTFLLPLILTAFALRRWLAPNPTRKIAGGLTINASQAFARQQFARIIVLLSLMTAIALVGAGLFYISESLIQLSLYRFTIYLKLFASIGFAWLLAESGWLTSSRRKFAWAATGLLLCVTTIYIVMNGGPARQFLMERTGVVVLMLTLITVAAIYARLVVRLQSKRAQNLVHSGGIVALALVMIVSWTRWLGVNQIINDPASYVGFCRWVNLHTPTDAVFLVPPHEQSFRWEARRAIVVNFKGVAQLSGELRTWRDRLQDVSGMPELTDLATPYRNTLPDLARRYSTRPASELIAVARRYGASYIVTFNPLKLPDDALSLAYESQGNFLYHLTEPASQPAR